MKEAKYQQNAVFHLSHKQKGKQWDLVLVMCEMDLPRYYWVGSSVKFCGGNLSGSIKSCDVLDGLDSAICFQEPSMKERGKQRN